MMCPCKLSSPCPVTEPYVGTEAQGHLLSCHRAIRRHRGTKAPLVLSQSRDRARKAQSQGDTQ
eukprot:1161464-Pelagomonas_calceolata.AAC.1